MVSNGEASRWKYDERADIRLSTANRAVTWTRWKGTTMALSESLRKQLADLVASNGVVLFMKGTPRMPQCGFSAQAPTL